MKAIWKSGQTVLFQGDSITDCDRNRQDEASLGHGYPQKVAQLYGLLFPQEQVKFVNRGISGNRVCDLLARYEEDFREVNPDFVSILVGINEAWLRYEDQLPPTPPDVFAGQYEELLQKIKRDMPHAKIMLIEPFLAPVYPERELWREDLEPRIREVRRLAVRYADYYVPLEDLVWTELVGNGRALPAELVYDSVHPTDRGHALIARAYLAQLLRGAG